MRIVRMFSFDTGETIFVVLWRDSWVRGRFLRLGLVKMPAHDYKSPTSKFSRILTFALLVFTRRVLGQTSASILYHLHPFRSREFFSEQLLSLSLSLSSSCSLFSYRRRSPPFVSSSTLFLFHLFFSIRLLPLLVPLSLAIPFFPSFPFVSWQMKL